MATPMATLQEAEGMARLQEVTVLPEEVMARPEEAFRPEVEVDMGHRLRASTEEVGEATARLHRA